MKLASSEGWKIVPAGAETWLDAGNLLERANVIVSTRRLNRIIEHEPADLVTITEAGATLRNLNLALGQSGQWLALDPPDDGRATIGGAVATGLGGAQQFGYGAPRRHVIGMKVVLADGSLFKTGGRVVKNVAGYDLCKLFAGSYGTLGVIVEVNFRLRPLPRETSTILVDGKLEQLLAGGRGLIDARLFPVAVELLSPRLGQEAGLSEGRDHLLLVRFAGALAGVAEQTNVASSLLKNGNGSQPNCRVVTDDRLIWQTLAALPLKYSQGVSWRVSVRTTDIGHLLASLDEHSRDGKSSEAIWEAGLGDGRIRMFQRQTQIDDDSITRLQKIRVEANKLGGAFAIESAPDELKKRFDAWGYAGNAAGLMRRVKQQLDPAGIFSPGRFDFGVC